jgi:uncharacterized protein YggE
MEGGVGMQTQTEKRLYALLILVVIGFLVVNSVMLYAILSGSQRITLVEPGEKESNIISVSGVGTVTATPDRAHVTFAVWIDAATATDAVNLNAEKMNRVIEALTDAGIPTENIETTSYSLEPVIQYPEKGIGPPKIVGYVARNEVEVTLTDITSVGRIIDKTVAAGANLVQGIYFTLSDGRAAQVRDQAIRAAVKDADSKAKAIAESLNVKVVGPISISLGYEYPMVQYAKAAEAGTTPIVPGALTITANVQATYRFE